MGGAQRTAAHRSGPRTRGGSGLEVGGLQANLVTQGIVPGKLPGFGHGRLAVLGIQVRDRRGLSNALHPEGAREGRFPLEAGSRGHAGKESAHAN